MRNPDRWSGLFFLLVSIFVIRESWYLKIGTYNKPGPGFLSFWVGGVVGILALLLFFLSFKGEEKPEGESLLREKRWRNILIVLISLTIYMIALEPIGFITTTFFFFGFLLRVAEPKRWYVVLTFAVVSTGAAWLVFEVWLGTPLPKGIFG